MMCLMALSLCTVFGCTKDKNTTPIDDTSDSYVDLGLPSGTKWNSSNEINSADPDYDFFTYSMAISQFGDKIPKAQQWSELIMHCEWTWEEMGYKVVGPNGNSIFLPAAGCREIDGTICDVGDWGDYWSSTTISDESMALNFGSFSHRVSPYNRNYGFSVRLVK